MMNLCWKVLAGTAASNPTGDEFDVTINVNIPLVLNGFCLTTDGRQQPVAEMEWSGNTLKGVRAGDVLVWTLEKTGSFFTAFMVNSDWTTVNISQKQMIAANDAGPIPEPYSDRPVPPASRAVFCGFGQHIQSGAQDYIVVREQFWKLRSESCTLAPGEAREVSFTQVTGMQGTSSDSATVAASLGVSANAGWGPISAGINASLNASATFSQQSTVTDQETTYISSTFTNDSDVARMYLRWQLMDMVTIMDTEWNVLSNITHALPPVIERSYNVPDLPAAPNNASTWSPPTVM